MSNPSAPNTFSALDNFKFDRVINEDPLTHSLTLLGTFPNSSVDGEPVPAIVRVEKTALDPTNAPRLLGDNGLIQRAVMEESTDIVRAIPLRLA